MLVIVLYNQELLRKSNNNNRTLWIWTVRIGFIAYIISTSLALLRLDHSSRNQLGLILGMDKKYLCSELYVKLRSVFYVQLESLDHTSFWPREALHGRWFIVHFVLSLLSVMLNFDNRINEL